MLDRMTYNCAIKIAGSHITLKKYSKSNSFNYTEKPRLSVPQAEKGKSENKKENFLKSIMRPRKRLFDLIACNVNQIADLRGNNQRPKFWTLTFKHNVTDLEVANAEFTKFNKRLSYHLYGVKSNVLKYICVPEFQKRGAVHYHVLYFNLPYVEQKEFQKVWGQGFTFVESVSSKDEIEDFAKYVSKYIKKENSKGEDNYDIYLEKDMLNQKRYFASRGLNKPSEFKIDIDSDLYKRIMAELSEFHTSNYETENDFVGRMEINNYEIKDVSLISQLREFIIAVYMQMKGYYNKAVNLPKMKKRRFKYYDFDIINKVDNLKNKAIAKYHGYDGFVMTDIRKEFKELGWT